MVPRAGSCRRVIMIEELHMTGTWLRAALFLDFSARLSFLARPVRNRRAAGGSVYARPTRCAARCRHRDDRRAISAIGKSGDIQAPADARVIDCRGKTIVAGFWNSHVISPKAYGATPPPRRRADERAYQEMLTGGVHHGVDLGSDPRDIIRCAAASPPARLRVQPSCLRQHLSERRPSVYVPSECSSPKLQRPMKRRSWRWLSRNGEDASSFSPVPLWVRTSRS